MKRKLSTKQRCRKGERGATAITLLAKELKKHIPALYSQEKEKDPRVICKFFDPVWSWTWYVIEESPVDTNGEVCAEQDAGDFLFFGFVVGFEAELGYFTERELEAAGRVKRRAGGAD